MHTNKLVHLFAVGGISGSQLTPDERHDAERCWVDHGRTNYGEIITSRPYIESAFLFAGGHDATAEEADAIKLQMKFMDGLQINAPRLVNLGHDFNDHQTRYGQLERIHSKFLQEVGEVGMDAIMMRMHRDDSTLLIAGHGLILSAIAHAWCAGRPGHQEIISKTWLGPCKSIILHLNHNSRVIDIQTSEDRKIAA